MLFFCLSDLLRARTKRKIRSDTPFEMGVVQSCQSTPSCSCSALPRCGSEQGASRSIISVDVDSVDVDGESTSEETDAPDFHHVMSASPSFEHCVFLVRGDCFAELPVPWPRQQDLPTGHFKVPKPGDLVVAVSHGWHFQAHPDPAGTKHRSIVGMVHSAMQVHPR